MREVKIELQVTIKSRYGIAAITDDVISSRRACRMYYHYNGLQYDIGEDLMGLRRPVYIGV